MNEFFLFIQKSNLLQEDTFKQIYRYKPFNESEELQYPGNVIAYALNKLMGMNIGAHYMSKKMFVCLKKLLQIIPKYIDTFTTKDSALTLFTLVQMHEPRLLESSRDTFHATNQTLLDQFLRYRSEACPQNLTKILWSIYKQNHLKIDKDSAFDIISLIHQKISQAVVPHDISLSIWSLVQLIKHGRIEPTLLPAQQIKELVQRFIILLPQAIPHNISNILWAIATLINEEAPLDNIHLEDIEPLMQKLNDNLFYHTNNHRPTCVTADSLWAYTIFLQKFKAKPNLAIYDNLKNHALDYINTTNSYIPESQRKKLREILEFLDPTTAQASSDTQTMNTSPISANHNQALRDLNQTSLLAVIARCTLPLDAWMTYLYTCYPFVGDEALKNPGSVLSFIMIELDNISDSSEYPSTFRSVSEYQNYILFKVLPLITANIQLLDYKSISVILHRLAKLDINGDTSLIVTDIVSLLIHTFSEQVSYCNTSLISDSQTVANSLWAAATLLKTEKIKSLSAATIAHLIDVFCMTQSKAEDITNILWAIPIFIKHQVYAANVSAINILIMQLNCKTTIADLSCIVDSIFWLARYMENIGIKVNSYEENLNIPNISMLILKFNELCDTTNNLQLCTLGLRAIALLTKFMPTKEYIQTMIVIGLNKVMYKVMVAQPEEITTNIKLNLLEALGILEYSGPYPLEELVEELRPPQKIFPEQLRGYPYAHVEFSVYVFGFFIDALLTMPDGRYLALTLDDSEDIKNKNSFRDLFLSSLNYIVHYTPPLYKLFSSQGPLFFPAPVVAPLSPMMPYSANMALQ